MPKVSIDGRDYDLETLSDEAKNNLASLRYCDERLKDLQRQMTVTQAARSVYAEGLSKALPHDS